MAISWDVKIMPLDKDGNYTVTADVTDDVTKVTEKVEILSCRLDDEYQKQHAWDTLKNIYEKRLAEKDVAAKNIGDLQAAAVDYLSKAVIKGVK
jgi:hypothetical protein